MPPVTRTIEGLQPEWRPYTRRSARHRSSLKPRRSRLAAARTRGSFGRSTDAPKIGALTRMGWSTLGLSRRERHTQALATLPDVDRNAEQQQDQPVQDRLGTAPVDGEHREDERHALDERDAGLPAAGTGGDQSGASAQNTYGMTAVIVLRLTIMS